VLVPLYLAARHWPRLPQRKLAALAVAAISSTLVTLACWRVWWGGWSYGPRLLVETVPWFALLTILGIKAFLEDAELTRNRRTVFIGAAVLLLTLSVTMNAAGALSRLPGMWNATPDIDTHPERIGLEASTISCLATESQLNVFRSLPSLDGSST
jgi:hypothetical protein